MSRQQLESISTTSSAPKPTAKPAPRVKKPTAMPGPRPKKTFSIPIDYKPKKIGDIFEIPWKIWTISIGYDRKS